MVLGSHGPGKLARKGKFAKVFMEGATGLLDPASKKPLAPERNGVALVQKRVRWCKRLLGDLCRLGPKDVLHPPLTSFGDIPFSGSFLGARHPQSGHFLAAPRAPDRRLLASWDCYNEQM